MLLRWCSQTSLLSRPRPFLPAAVSVLCSRILLYNKLNPSKPMAAGRRAASFAAPRPELVREALFLPPGVAKEDVTVEMVLPGSNIVVGPYAGDARIKQAEFVKSSSRAKDCPKDDRPEFAVIGRSNVGKSSLINALVRQKDIALTSKKPGKTQLINHFLINRSWYIVDLPGYGYVFWIC
ncbi:GTP-binding protein At2g22870-like [Phalaenopsis equestris]|uniref:GTP-binding protein At2g22870-like n=1 Tax=Phalaenopsis equestris TaxID=78828 RepID=UPI0009E5C21B|nr:GTP-binding protein At2g22870-like [Phalaenopsis equestris]